MPRAARLAALSLCAASLLALAGCGAPPQADPGTRAPAIKRLKHDRNWSASVAPGETVQLWRAWNFDAACKFVDHPQFEPISEPRLGRVEVAHGPIKVRISDTALRRCAGKALEGARLLYHAGDAAGTDEFYVTQTLNHRRTVIRFTVTVR